MPPDDFPDRRYLITAQELRTRLGSVSLNDSSEAQLKMSTTSRQATDAESGMMLVGKRLALLSVALLSIIASRPIVGSPAYGSRPAIPRIEDSGGWRLSEGCRVLKFGRLTDPDCDLLTGDGVAIQVTRVRILSLPPGQDNRPAIGIQIQPAHGDWYFSSPFVALSIAGRSYAAGVEQALVFARDDRPILPEKLGPDQQRYELPTGEKRFFRLRFSVDQSELGKGFSLRVTGLHKEGQEVRVPIMKFE